jgi:hypothetical protein
MPLPGFSTDLSDKAEVSMLTILPGSELYTLFGHNAIRIKDPLLKIDTVYNYGTFDFNDPNFVIKFLAGTLDYFLDTGHFSQSLYHNIKIENRTVIEQCLRLNLQTKQELYDFLRNNQLPDNKYYRYDFTNDNCTTRIRNIFNNLLKEHLHYVDFRKHPFSYRTQISSYLKNNPFLDFSFALLLGPNSDRITSFQEGMYLPMYLMKSFEKAEINTGKEIVPLVWKKNIIYRSTANAPDPPPFSPVFLSWVLLVIYLIISLSGLLNKHPVFVKTINRLGKISDFFLLFFLGFTGCLIIFLWLFSNHSIADKNWNLLFLLPTHGIAAFLNFFTCLKKYLRKYFLFSFYLFSLYVVFQIFLINQFFHPAFLPLLLLTGIRLLLLSRKTSV